MEDSHNSPAGCTGEASIVPPKKLSPLISFLQENEVETALEVRMREPVRRFILRNGYRRALALTELSRSGVEAKVAPSKN